MLIREYRAGDEKFLRAVHAGDGFDYELPDLGDPRLWITRQVLTRADGLPVMAVLGRLTSEAFLLIDPHEKTSGPQTMRRILALAERACADGRSMGIDSCHAWLAPEIAEKFGPQIARMGWMKHDWPTYVKSI